MIEAPTGVVTLVFTDVQDSTVLWDRAPQAMRAALTVHDDIMRETLNSAQGYEVKTEGDAFMVAFASAPAAIGWCLQVQERLMDADWPTEILSREEAGEVAGADGAPVLRGLRVRMGAHTGEPLCEPHPQTGKMDYFGGMVNRAARVASAGHGGQLIISEATWQAIESIADEVVVTDLGEHALKGLERHESLRQLQPPRLAGRVFPRLKTPSLKKTNLPTHLDSFFGRESDLENLEERLKAGRRLITLIGAGGTGKTRLSQRFGAQQLANFSGGVWFCDLTEARSLSGVLSAMGTALQIQLTQEDPQDQMATAIRGHGPVLIVLDNFEQVVEYGADTVGRWLQEAPEVVFLVTSRRILHLVGEETVYLDPLPVNEAINLFFDRASTAQPGFARTTDIEPTVREIVERLDCMSLAIELAAARLRMMPPKQILARLSQRFDLLRGQRRDQSDRQATLRGAIDWSWDLLKPSERSALAQLSIFHGGSTLEAAEAVLDLEAGDDEPWVMDTIEALVDHSLLRRVEPFQGYVRYRMLESVRAYALEKLAQDTHATALRHATHFAGFGSQAFMDSLDRHGGTERRHALALDFENLIAAVEAALAADEPELAASCCLAVVAVFELKGPFLQGLTLLEQVDSERLSPALHARLLKAAGDMLRLAGKLDEALAKQQQALAIHQTLGDRRSEGRTLLSLGMILLDHRRIDDALSHLKSALHCHRDQGDRDGQARCLCYLGNLHLGQGRYAQAQTHYEEALSLSQEVGIRRLEGMVLINLGVLHDGQGRPDQALSNYQQAIAIHQEIGDRRIEGHIHGNLGSIWRNQGATAKALLEFERALAIHREVGNRNGEGLILGNIGDIHHLTGDLAAAEQFLVQAIELLDQGSSSWAGIFRGTLALICSERGDFSEARALLERGDHQLRGIHLLELGKLLCKRARIEQQAGDHTSASSAFAEAETIAVELEVIAESDLGRELGMARAALAE